MGDVSQAIEVSLQDIPAHLVVEWVAELCWHLKKESTSGVLQHPIIFYTQGILRDAHPSHARDQYQYKTQTMVSWINND